MSWFGFQRSEGYPTQYGSNKTPVTVDVLIAGFICSFIIIAISSCVLLSGYRGKQVVWVSIRIFTILFLGAVIMVDNFGQSWEVAEVSVNDLLYKAGSNETINATVSMKFGFRALNITLKAHPDPPGEKIDFNERFWWTWDQGRNGFGPYAGQYNQDYRAAQRKGLPLPILWVAEYLTFDGDGIRWGRHYRLAGWFAHIAQWVAFPLWILTTILFFSVIQYGAYCLTMTGVCMVIANLIWMSVRNSMELAIPLESLGNRSHSAEDMHEEVLRTHFGGNFWLNLIVGILCIVLGVVVIILNQYCSNELADFFGIDPLADFEEYHYSPDELQNKQNKRGAKKTSGNYEGLNVQNDVELAVVGEDGVPVPIQPQPPEPQDIVVFKRRTTSRFGHNKIRKPIAPPRLRPGLQVPDEDPLYENFQGAAAADDQEVLYGNLQPPPRPPR